MIPKKLNADQLTELAKLCFDLSKGTLALVILPAAAVPEDPTANLLRVLLGLFWGLVFIRLGLLILEHKIWT